MQLSRENIQIVIGKPDALRAEQFLMECQLIANDIETLPDAGLMTVNGYTGLAANGQIQSFVFPFYNSKSPKSGTPTDVDAFLQVGQRVNASGIPFTFHNGSYDLFWHVRYGMPVANYAYDSMSMFWAFAPELPKTLAFVSSILLDDYVYWKGGRKSDDWTTHLLYNGRDCYRTLANTIRLVDILSQDSQIRNNWIDAHLRILSFLAMSLRGIRHDSTKLHEHATQLAKDAEETLAKLRYMIDDPNFNPQSPPQKKELLYKLLGARLRDAKGKFVKEYDDASTGKTPLRAMRVDHPIIRRVANGIMESLEPAKQISNIVGMRVSKWGRAYTGYNGVGTTTTRASSTEAPIRVGTNFQNWRKHYRDILTAEPDCFLLDIDFSASDDVFVTYESADPRKIELARSGRDSHAQNTTLFFPDWTYEQVVAGKKAKDSDPELYQRITHPITGIRQITKKLSHGCNYLMAGLTLLMTAGREAIVAAAIEVGYKNAGFWTQDKLVEFCASREDLYRNYYTRFKRHGADSWYGDLRREVVDTHGFTTPFHYFQRFLGDSKDDKVLRAVAATAGQAGTAGRINAAMVELDHGIIRPTFRDGPNPHADREPLRISRADHGISLRLQSHDSLTWNVDPRHSAWEEGVSRIFEVMQRPVVIRNKLTGKLEEFRINIETEVGAAWGPGLKDSKNSVEDIKSVLGL